MKRRSKLLIHAIAAIALWSISGCTSVTTKMVYHPTIPTPIKQPDVRWNVETVDNKVRVWLSWEDSQKLGLFFSDVDRYLKENKVIIEYYRKELDSQ